MTLNVFAVLIKGFVGNDSSMSGSGMGILKAKQRARHVGWARRSKNGVAGREKVWGRTAVATNIITGIVPASIKVGEETFPTKIRTVTTGNLKTGINHKVLGLNRNAKKQ